MADGERLQDLGDAELVRRCRSGEREAFDVIALRYLGVMHAVALARLADCDAAEDLVQEVMLRAFMQLDRLQKPESLGPWLTRITRNMALNWVRDGRTRSDALSLVPLEDVEHVVADERQKGARTVMQEKETESALEAAIMALEPDDRELVLLYYAEELSKKDIAEKLGVHPATVGRRLDKAFAEMRRTLEPTVREASKTLRPRRRLEARTLAVLAAGAALTAETKSAIASTAGAVAFAEASSAASASLSWSFFSNIVAAFDTLSKGTIIMGMKVKIAALVAAVGLAGGGVYVATHEEPKPKEQVVAQAQTAVEKTKPTEAPISQGDMRMAYVLSGKQPEAFIDATEELIGQTAIGSQDLKYPLQKMKQVFPEIGKIERFRLALLIDDPAKQARNEDQIFAVLELKEGQSISVEAIDEYLNSMLIGDLNIRVNENIGSSMMGFSVRSSSEKFDREMWTSLKDEMLSKAAVSSPTLHAELFLQNVYLSSLQKGMENYFMLLQSMPEKMRLSPNVLAGGMFLELARQSDTLEFSLTPDDNAFLVETHLKALDRTELATFFEECRDERAGDLLKKIRGHGAVRLGMAWDQAAFNTWMDKAALTVEGLIEFGDTPEANADEEELKTAWREAYETYVKPSLPLNTNALAFSTLQQGQGMGATYLLARGDKPEGMEKSIEQILSAFEYGLQDQFRLAKGTATTVGTDSEASAKENARYTTDPAMIGLNWKHFRFYPVESGDGEFNDVVRTLAFNKADPPNIGGEYAVVDDTVALAFAAGSVEPLAGILKGVTDASPMIAPMPSAEMFGEDAMGYIEVYPLGIVMWAQQFASKMSKAKQNVFVPSEQREAEFALYDPAQQPEAQMTAMDMAQMAVAFAADGPVLMAIEADDNDAAVGLKVKLGPNLTGAAILYLTNSLHLPPSAEQMRTHNPDAKIEGENAQLILQKAHGDNAILFTPWCNIMLPDLGKELHGKIIKSTPFRPSSGNPTGGSIINSITLSTTSRSDQRIVGLNGKVILRIDGDIATVGDRTFNITEGFAGLIEVDMEACPDYNKAVERRVPDRQIPEPDRSNDPF